MEESIYQLQPKFWPNRNPARLKILVLFWLSWFAGQSSFNYRKRYFLDIRIWWRSRRFPFGSSFTLHSLKLRSFNSFPNHKGHISNSNLNDELEICPRRENFKSRALPLEFFSFELHRTTVCDSLASAYPWKAEVNGFGAYHGKAQQKDNIREGTVGHQIVVHSSVLPFQDFGRAIVINF